MNSDAYPSEAVKTKIEDWPTRNNAGLARYIVEVWHPMGYAKYANGQLRLMTGGWSGNEQLVDALKNNVFFWAACWVKSERGGLFVFKIPKAQ